MVVHGGSWFRVGKVYLATASARWFVRHGYTAYDIDYRAAYDSLVDVVAAYDHLRRIGGRRAEICAYGESAGGQLVELLAASRPSLNCVISAAGIEDLRWLSHQCAYGRPCASVDTGARWAFGDRLWEFSPVRLGRYITQPFLAAGSAWDSLIDERAQLAEMMRARPATDTMLLPGAPTEGSRNFMHASVTPAAPARYQAAVLEALSGAGRLASVRSG